MAVPFCAVFVQRSQRLFDGSLPGEVPVVDPVLFTLQPLGHLVYHLPGHWFSNYHVLGVPVRGRIWIRHWFTRCRLRAHLEELSDRSSNGDLRGVHQDGRA